MLSEITGGASLGAAPCVNRAGLGRYSIPFFFDPDFDARFATAGIQRRRIPAAQFNKFYQYRKELSEPAA